MKKFLLIVICIFLFLSAPANAIVEFDGFPNTEATQLLKLASDIKEVAEQVLILKQHLAMLNSLKSRLLELGNGQIMNVFSEAQIVLRNTKSLASDVSNFSELFRERFPDDYQGIVSAVSEGKRLADNWRNVQEGYMRVLNMTAKNFNNEQQIRSKMLETLYETDSDSGQTKAIQIIGAMVNHASFLMDRSNQYLSGFMGTYITKQQTKKQRQKINKRNIIEMAGRAAQIEDRGETFEPGFKK